MRWYTLQPWEVKSNDLNCLYKAEASGDPFGKASASFRFMILDLSSAMRILKLVKFGCGATSRRRANLQIWRRQIGFILLPFPQSDYSHTGAMSIVWCLWLLRYSIWRSVNDACILQHTDKSLREHWLWISHRLKRHRPEFCPAVGSFSHGHAATAQKNLKDKE